MASVPVRLYESALDETSVDVVYDDVALTWNSVIVNCPQSEGKPEFTLNMLIEGHPPFNRRVGRGTINNEMPIPGGPSPVTIGTIIPKDGGDPVTTVTFVGLLAIGVSVDGMTAALQHP